MDLERSSMSRTKRTPDNGQPCLTPRCGEKNLKHDRYSLNNGHASDFSQNTACNIIIENCYPNLNVKAEVEEPKRF